MRKTMEATAVLVTILVVGLASVYLFALRRPGPMPTPAAAKQACRTPAECQYFESLKPLLGPGKAVAAVRLNPPCERCRLPEFKIADLESPPVRPVPSDVAARLSGMLGDTDSYILGGARKAMPFIADYALQFGEPADQTMLLFSSFGATVRIMAPGVEQIVIVNIDPIAERLFKELERATR